MALRIDLGSIGAVLHPGEHPFVDHAIELERLGYSTIWLTGGPLSELSQIADVVGATRTARIATGIIAVDRFRSEDVARLYMDLEREHPGRFVVGLGGAHGPNPLATLNAYLDRLDAVPRNRRVMAALGPRMLELARERAGGAFPVLVTPQYVGRAKAIVGAETTLAVEQLVVLEADANHARRLARGPFDVLGGLPAYQASFKRMGFNADDIASTRSSHGAMRTRSPDGSANSKLPAPIMWPSAWCRHHRNQHPRSGAGQRTRSSVDSRAPARTIGGFSRTLAGGDNRSQAVSTPLWNLVRSRGNNQRYWSGSAGKCHYGCLVSNTCSADRHMRRRRGSRMWPRRNGPSPGCALPWIPMPCPCR